MQNNSSVGRMNVFITSVSVAVPVVVAVLLAIQNKVDLGDWTKTLPHVIGAVNTVTSVTLLLGLLFIKRGRVDAHRTMMFVSLLLGAVFLVCYVLYHLSNEPRRFAGGGALRIFYLVVLLSHIGLSLVVLPLVLRAAGFAFVSEFERHRKLARIAFPIWLYVSVTGVVVYLLGHQFNPLN